MRMRGVHRLLGVVLFVPTLLWGLSGAFLAWKNWVSNRPEASAENRAKPALRPFRVDVPRALAATGKPNDAPLRSIEWRHLAEDPYFVIQYEDAPQPMLISGESGAVLSGVPLELALRIAARNAPKGLRVTGCVLQEKPSLIYLPGMELPVYRAALSDGSEMYLSPTSGELFFHVPRLAWAIRFAFYILHVWQFSQGPGPHYSYLVLLVMALLLSASGVSGLVLWLRTFGSSSRRRAKRDTAAP